MRARPGCHRAAPATLNGSSCASHLQRHVLKGAAAQLHRRLGDCRACGRAGRAGPAGESPPSQGQSLRAWPGDRHASRLAPAWPAGLTVCEGDIPADGHPCQEPDGTLDCQRLAMVQGGHLGRQSLQLVHQPAVQKEGGREGGLGGSQGRVGGCWGWGDGRVGGSFDGGAKERTRHWPSETQCPPEAAVRRPKVRKRQGIRGGARCGTTVPNSLVVLVVQLNERRGRCRQHHRAFLSHLVCICKEYGWRYTWQYVWQHMADQRGSGEHSNAHWDVLLGQLYRQAGQPQAAGIGPGVNAHTHTVREVRMHMHAPQAPPPSAPERSANRSLQVLTGAKRERGTTTAPASSKHSMADPMAVSCRRQPGEPGGAGRRWEGRRLWCQRPRGWACQLGGERA